MEDERARELLARERERIEAAMQSHSGHPLESDGESAPGDRGDESLYQDELDAGLRHDLEEQLAAVQRAEERLQGGTYGRSVLSGLPIPDGRLEARPTAEYTIEEQQDQGG
jgi:DnaK suppressor protein